MTHQEELLEALGITPEEFELNKKGSISEKQIELLNDVYMPGASRCLLAGFSALVLPYVICYTITMGFNRYVLGLTFTGYILILFMMGLVSAAQTRESIKNVEQRLVESKEGNLEQATISKISYNTPMPLALSRYWQPRVTRPILKMDKRQFYVSQEKLFEVIKKDHPYRIYYVNHRILAIEDLAPGQVIS